MMSGILEFLWEAAVQSAVLFAAILALRALLKGRASPRLHYVLWGLMLLRLLLPLPVDSPVSVMNAVEPTTAAVRQFVQPQIVTAPPATPTGGAEGAVAGAAPFGWPQALTLLWLLGMAATAGHMAVANARFYRRAMRGARPLRLTREAARALGAAGFGRAVPVYVSTGVPSPCLLGLIRPRVLVTKEAAAMPERLHHILLHELCHLRQLDNWIALMRNIACAVHWFNPLVWAAARLSRRDCELACDAAALTRLGRNHSLAYGETLVALIRSRRDAGLIYAATTMATGKREMMERLNMIVRQPRTVAAVAVAAILVSVTLAAVACTGAVKGSPVPAATPQQTQTSTLQPANPAIDPSASTQSSPAPTSTPLPDPTDASPTVTAGSATPEPVSGKGTKLWEQDGWTYWIESRAGEDIATKDGKSNPLGNRIGRLYRTQGKTRETLDEFVKLNANDGSWRVLPTGDRIVHIGFSGEVFTEWKGSGSIVSINPDGSDRRVYAPKYNTASNLCYDGGYLYYEGWTNAGAFPRPLNRLNTDLTNDYRMADIDGVFITARSGYAYYMGKKGNQVYRLRLDWKSKPERYQDGFDTGTRFTVRQTGETEYLLTNSESGETFTLKVEQP